MPETKRGGGILRKILIAIALVVIVFLGYVAAQPSAFSVTRSTTIDAPPATVFAQVNDFHKWEAWSPWAKLDPNAKNSFEGPSEGKGAKFHWAGNSDVGEGGMEITESNPNELIRIKLDFLKPFEATSTTLFKFEPAGSQTKITWTMSGENNFVGRIFCTFMNMDKTVGGDFEKGLASMKATAEKSAVEGSVEVVPATDEATAGDRAEGRVE